MTKQDWKIQHRAERVAERNAFFKEYRVTKKLQAMLYTRITAEVEPIRKKMRDADLFFSSGKSLASL